MSAHRRCRTADRTIRLDERIAVYLDLENLLAGRTDPAARRALEHELASLAQRGTIVAAVAACNHALASEVVFDLAPLGVRTFLHHGGADAADLVLLEKITFELPATATTVVIGSGDHIFADAADALRARGIRVEVIALERTLSAQLYLAADHCTVLSPPADTSSLR